MKKHVLLIAITLIGLSCAQRQKEVFDVEKQLDYCVNQASQTLKLIPGNSQLIPRNVLNGKQDWTFVEFRDWTSGFWPGELWYLYEYTGDEKWKKAADQYTQYLKPLSVLPAGDHDLGFQVFNSAGNGFRLTGDSEYKDFVLMTADTLATLFNPLIGTILSWPVKRDIYPHNTIVDNMINLELLFWASKNGGDRSLYDLAVTHAEKTMENHFREDYSAYHVLVYDTITGDKIRGITHQGYADESMWARGQTWAIYGYTMVYRETKDPKFLDFAHKVAGVYLDRLPNDMIPYWDFDAPNIPDEPRDASAATIAASALLELSGYTEDKNLASEYREKAAAMLEELSTNYQSKDENTALLMHSTGHHPGGSEIDASIIYADYYYVEALLRLKKIQEGQPAVNSVLAGFGQHSSN